jgi:hypothetical protein
VVWFWELEVLVSCFWGCVPLWKWLLEDFWCFVCVR